MTFVFPSAVAFKNPRHQSNTDSLVWAVPKPCCIGRTSQESQVSLGKPGMSKPLRPSHQSPLSRSGSCPVLRKPAHSGHPGPGRGPTAPSHSPTNLMATGSNVWAWKSWMGAEHQLGTSKSEFRLWAPAAAIRPAPTESLHSLPRGLPSCFPSHCSKSMAPPPTPAQTAPCLLPLERRPLLEAGQSSASPWSSPGHASHVSHASEPQELRPASPSASCGSVSPTGAPEAPPTRIAVVGAGPVGLWIAVLLARAHARIFQTSTGFRISRHPQAPVINVT